MPITTRQTGSLASENWTKVYQTFRDADFTSYDFESLRKTMIDYIRVNYSEEFNDFTESSEFIALIDLIAFLGQSLAFRTDLNARENFIDTAERRDSILKLARLISYNSKRNSAASGYLKIDSISTSESVFDSDGLDLSNRIILWNDNSNSNWFEQFISVLNASLLQHQNFGRPANNQTINKIRTEEYGINLINNILPIFKFESSVNGLTTNFEVVSASSAGKSFVYEVSPDINKPLNVLYRNDGNGNGSNNTGFFFYFKQGELSNFDFAVETQVPNKTVAIDINDINNNDVWLYKLDNQGFTDTLWEQVPTTTGVNVVYNSSSQKNLYQVNSRSNDQISLVFGDGTFANVPLGNFRLFYRVSNGLNYKITPDEMQGIQISLDYVSRNNRVETITFTASLRYTVANASSRETADEIKQRAPQQYYTQNRMVTGEDYNIFPYTSYADIKKVKAVNRISSGLSRYLDVLDTTGKYSSTNIFGEDGVLYTDKTVETINFSYKSENEIRKYIRTYFIPNIIDDASLKHYYYERVSPELPDINDVVENKMIDGELYQISSSGTTDFTQYGATSSLAGQAFRAVNSGKQDKIYTVNGYGTAAFLLNGNLTAYNPTITAKAGDKITFNLDINQPLHIKSTAVGGFIGNVTAGIVTNNGSTKSVSWDTTNVPAGTYYYVSRNYGGPCYDMNVFVAQNRGQYVPQVYRETAEKIAVLYRSNNEFLLSDGEIRYGLYQNPDHSGLAYWTNECLTKNYDPESATFFKIFFTAADPLTNRHKTPTKDFVIGTYGICGFSTVPTGYSTNFMAGRIIIGTYGTGTVTTSLKWNQSTIGNGVCTGYFTYNGQPVSVGQGVQGINRYINTGAMIKFTPDIGYRFNSNFNMIPGMNLNPGDALEKFVAVSQIFGDGTNNGQGNFANGQGPVTINLPIPTGAVVEAIIPTYKNSLRDFVVDEMVELMSNKEIFGLNYSVTVQNWILVPANELEFVDWLIKFDWNSVINQYVISFKSSKYVFYSPKETNFFFDKTLQVFDTVNNRVVNDSIKILRNNIDPGYVGLLPNDSEWYINSEVKRPDGYIENKRVYLTYADSNQDGVPDVPNLFDNIVIGGPYRTTRPGIQAQKYAVYINYYFKSLVGRYPTVTELNSYVDSLTAGEYRLSQLRGSISNLDESKLFLAGKYTAKELVYFQLVKTDYGNEYELLDNSKVIAYFNTKSQIEQAVKNFNLGQLFYAREDNQFYKIIVNKFSNKVVSDGLNLSSSTAVPNYIVNVGRQNLYYQYRHNSPNTNRIDPNISNIIDLYVLTNEYENSYKLWLADTTYRLTEPEAPTDLELYNRYADLENFKSISDTLVIQSAKFKPLFGAKAASEYQAMFKVVKNSALSITDADVKTSVIAAINTYFSTENWDFGDTFYFSELAAYLHKVLTPNIASIVIVSKNAARSFGNLYQINAEPYEIIVSAATVDDVEIVTAITAIDLQPTLA